MKRNLSALLLLLFAVQAMAGPVSRQEAMKSAQLFLSQRGIKAAAVQSAECRVQGKKSAHKEADASVAASPLYVFNVGGGGYVIVSGDDRTDAVLGYSTSGHFDEAAMPPNMRAWLQGYADQISAMNADEQTPGGAQKARRYAPLTSSIDFHDAVATILKTEWDQDDPYNQFCPVYGDKNCATGCTATATAQVMNHYKYPAYLPAIGGYTTNTLKLEVPELGEVSAFNWEALKDTYKKGERGEAADAVATLMLYCGQSMGMDYNTAANGGSGVHVSNAVDALLNIFHYQSAELASRVQYTEQGWDNLIYNELKQGYPVIYSGCGPDPSSGHAFVCDGYDGRGYYHINWGWSGDSNDYFLLSALNPLLGGIGAGDWTNGYNLDHQAVVHLRAHTAEPHATKPIVFKDLNGKMTEDFLQVECAIPCGGPEVFEFGLGYLTEDKKVVNVHEQPGVELSTENTHTMQIYASQLRTLSDGPYRMVPTCRRQGEEEWRNIFDNENYYIDVEYSNGRARFVKSHPDYCLKVDVKKVLDTVYEKSENQFEVTVTNTGSDMVRKILKLSDSKEDVSSSLEEKDFHPGETYHLRFMVKPKKAGGFYIQLKDQYGGEYGDSLLIPVMPLPDAPLDVTVSNWRFIGGKNVRLDVDITNNDDFQHPSRNASLKLQLQVYGQTEIGNQTPEATINAIAPGQTTTASFQIMELAANGWEEFTATEIILKPVKEGGKPDTLTIEDARQTFCHAQLSCLGCGDFSSPYNLNIAACEGLMAYTGRMNAERDALVLTAHNLMPANTGMVLSGEPYAHYAIPATGQEVEAIEDNDLVAAIDSILVEAGSVLCPTRNEDGNLCFSEFNGTVIEARHAYLEKEKADGRAHIGVVIVEDPAEIRTLCPAPSRNSGCLYNLQGVRVNSDYKGIVVRNGKKVARGAGN